MYPGAAGGDPLWTSGTGPPRRSRRALMLLRFDSEETRDANQKRTHPSSQSAFDAEP